MDKGESVRCLILGLALATLCLGSGRTRAAAEDDLLVFVGERVSVKRFEPVLGPNELLMDAAFKARFRIRQVLHGSYRGEVVAFEAYDHYGWPGFSGVANSLLFVSRVGDTYYQHKYQYYPVFRTADGGWAGCGPVGENDARARRGVAEARPIAFAEAAFHPLREEWSSATRRKLFARRHFRLVGDRAYCLSGTPVQELFEAKKRSSLREDGLFGGRAD